MALQQVFQAALSDDGATLFLFDETGNYDSVSNPTGYGAPNTARTDLALILIGKYKATAGDASIVVSAYDPENVIQWSSTGISTAAGPDVPDGHYEYKVYSVPRSGTEGAPVTNNFRYDFVTNALQRYNGSTWVSAVTADLETYDFDHITVDDPVLTDMQRALNNLNRLGILGCKTCSKSEIQAFIVDTSTMLNGSLSLFAEQSFAQMQENVEKYQSRVNELMALA